VFSKTGANYSSTELPVSEMLNDKGSIVIPPKNCILEIKFLDTDIKGAAV
jgi:hypothetical protein